MGSVCWQKPWWIQEGSPNQLINLDFTLSFGSADDSGTTRRFCRNMVILNNNCPNCVEFERIANTWYRLRLFWVRWNFMVPYWHGSPILTLSCCLPLSNTYIGSIYNTKCGWTIQPITSFTLTCLVLTIVKLPIHIPCRVLGAGWIITSGSLIIDERLSAPRWSVFCWQRVWSGFLIFGWIV